MNRSEDGIRWHIKQDLELRYVSWEAIELQRHRDIDITNGSQPLDLGATDLYGQGPGDHRLAGV